MSTIFVLILIVVAFGGGWYLKGRYGAKAAADLQAVQDTAKKL